MSFANNHRLDYLEQGSADTVEALEGAGVVYAYDKNVAIYETKGIRIGYVSVNQLAWGYYGLEQLIQTVLQSLRKRKRI